MIDVAEAHPQLSPESEHCDLCAAENQPSRIPFYTPYHLVITTDGAHLNLCDEHYYNDCNVATDN
jgi:hypothetical protein